jgi:hypothetical protein
MEKERGTGLELHALKLMMMILGAYEAQFLFPRDSGRCGDEGRNGRAMLTALT